MLLAMLAASMGTGVILSNLIHDLKRKPDDE